MKRSRFTEDQIIGIRKSMMLITAENWPGWGSDKDLDCFHGIRPMGSLPHPENLRWHREKAFVQMIKGGSFLWG